MTGETLHPEIPNPLDGSTVGLNRSISEEETEESLRQADAEVLYQRVIDWITGVVVYNLSNGRTFEEQDKGHMFYKVVADAGLSREEIDRAIAEATAKARVQHQIANSSRISP